MRAAPLLFAIVAFVAIVVAGCAPGGSTSSAPAPAAPVASVPSWLCRPDLPSDPCRAADLTATELRADGSQVVVPHHAAEHPQVDCFYVYPTVDLDLVPANHENLADDRFVRAVTIAQAARFSEACALWVPRYRQVNIGTYLQPKDTLERGLARAFGDVERAFSEYLAQADPAHKIVLIGHSQGAEMVVRLLRRFFDDDDAGRSLRSRLLLALPIGGDVDSGTMKNVPACIRPNQTACIVAYRTHAAGERVDPDRWAPPAGRETACVDPAALDGGAGAGDVQRLSRSYFALWPEVRRFMHGVSDVKTPFVVVRDFYAARCVRGPGAYAYLEVSGETAAGDKRTSPVNLHDKRLRIGKLGLHVLDMQLAQGDLVDMVARRARVAQDSAERQ